MRENCAKGGYISKNPKWRQNKMKNRINNNKNN
jgi:hypothetical protein